MVAGVHPPGRLTRQTRAARRSADRFREAAHIETRLAPTVAMPGDAEQVRRQPGHAYHVLWAGRALRPTAGFASRSQWASTPQRR